MSEKTSVRERVKAIQVALRDTPNPPISLIRDVTIALSALYGNVLDEVRASEFDYSRVLVEQYEKEGTHAAAKLRGEATAEYLRLREAQDTEKLVMELIRSCRRALESLDGEMRLSR